MDSVTYIYRKVTPGQHSIEALFEGIIPYVNKQLVVNKVCLPFFSKGLVTVFKNIFHLKKTVQNPVPIYHVTGDVHYAALGLPSDKTILTIHDVHSIIKGSLLKKIICKLLWFVLPSQRVKFITVISEFTKKELLALLPDLSPEKVKVIPNPVSPLIQFQPKEKLSAIPKILHLGTKDNKNLERLIQAIKGIEIELLIVGKLNPSQLQLLQLHAINYQNFYDLKYDQVVEIYYSCDLVSFVSTYEGFGMPILEAQAAGRPVITSNICSMPAVAGAGALLVDPFSTEEIRMAITQLLSSPTQREDLVKKGLENVSNYSVEQIGAQYLQLYINITGRA